MLFHINCKRGFSSEQNTFPCGVASSTFLAGVGGFCKKGLTDRSCKSMQPHIDGRWIYRLSGSFSRSTYITSVRLHFYWSKVSSPNKRVYGRLFSSTLLMLPDHIFVLDCFVLFRWCGENIDGSIQICTASRLSIYRRVGSTMAL